MPIDTAADALGVVSGMLVGFSLGLVGGGGSILSVPLMIYLVGVPNVHVAIGTTAFAVAVNAAATLVSHARMGTVIWSCAAAFALAGMVGAYGGSSLSKIVDGQKLLVLFALLMLIIAAVMFMRRSAEGDKDVKLTRKNLPRLARDRFPDRSAVRLLRHRRRFSHRARTDVHDGNADHQCRRLLARRRHRIRRHGGLQLRGLGPRRLAARRLVHPRRGVRRRSPAGRPRRRSARGAAPSTWFSPASSSWWRSTCWRAVCGEAAMPDRFVFEIAPSEPISALVYAAPAPMCRAPTSRSSSAMAPGPARTAPSW